MVADVPAAVAVPDSGACPADDELRRRLSARCAGRQDRGVSGAAGSDVEGAAFAVLPPSQEHTPLSDLDDLYRPTVESAYDRGAALFPPGTQIPAGTETWAGGVPRIAAGTAIPGIAIPAGTETWAGGVPQLAATALIPPAGTETWAGGVPRLVATLLIPAGASSDTGGTPRVGAQYADSFNRADSSTSLAGGSPAFDYVFPIVLGASVGDVGFPYTLPITFGAAPSGSGTTFASWTNRLGVMGIQTNMAYPVVDNQENIATYDPAMIYDDMRVSLVVGTSSGGLNDGLILVLGANTTGECVTARLDNGGTWSLQTRTVWASPTTQASQILQSYTTGDVLSLERTSNVYVVKKNGASSGLTLNDTTNFIPRNASHRIVGVGSTSSLANYRRIDSWTAENI